MADEDEDSDFDDDSSFSSGSHDEPSSSENSTKSIQMTSAKQKGSVLSMVVNIFCKNNDKEEGVVKQENPTEKKKEKRETKEKKKVKPVRTRRRPRAIKKKKVVRHNDSSDSEIFDVTTSILEINEGLYALERSNDAHPNLKFSTPSTILRHITRENSENCPRKSFKGANRKASNLEGDHTLLPNVQKVVQLQDDFKLSQENKERKLITMNTALPFHNSKDPHELQEAVRLSTIINGSQTGKSKDSMRLREVDSSSDSQEVLSLHTVDNTIKAHLGSCTTEGLSKPPDASNFFTVRESKYRNTDGQLKTQNASTFFTVGKSKCEDSKVNLNPFHKPREPPRFSSYFKSKKPGWPSDFQEAVSFHTFLKLHEIDDPPDHQDAVSPSDIEKLSTIVNAESKLKIDLLNLETNESYANLPPAVSASVSNIKGIAASLVDLALNANTQTSRETSSKSANATQNRKSAKSMDVETKKELSAKNKIKEKNNLTDRKNMENTVTAKYQSDEESVEPNVSMKYGDSTEDITSTDDRKSYASIEMGNNMMTKKRKWPALGMKKLASTRPSCARKFVAICPEKTVLSKNIKKRYIIITVAICLCVGGIIFLSTAAAYDVNMSDPALTPEASLRQFLSSLQVQKVDNETADWSSDLKELKSPRAQKIINALKPRIRSAFEAEGFTTDHVNITKIEPISVIMYHVLNYTVTSLSSSEEISMVSSFEKEKGTLIPAANKPRPDGHRLIIRVEFETSGKPSDNAEIINQVGEAEAVKIQYMIQKYLENQGVIAKPESLEVSPEFQRKAKMATAKPRSQFLKSIMDPDLDIDCYITVKKLGLSRAIVRCPPQCIKVAKQIVIGTNWYHINSMICLTALHNSLLENNDGGVVEVLTAGDSFIFLGSSKNGIDSTTLLGYGKKFIIKVPGPSWTTAIITTTVRPKHPELQEASMILLKGSMAAISVDKIPIGYSPSHSYNSKITRDMSNLLGNKVLYSLEDMKFNLDRVKVFGFEPDSNVTKALRFLFTAYGKYGRNSEAFFRYNPWNESLINKFVFNLASNLDDEGLQTANLAVKLNDDIIVKMSTMLATTITPTTNFSFVCTCSEVFFLQSGANTASRTEVVSILNMYKKLFELADFDQHRLKVGMALIVPKESEQSTNGKPYVVITDVGQSSTTDIIIELEYQLITVVESRTRDGVTEEIMSTLRGIKDLKFFKEDFDTRGKLLVVNSDTVFGPDSEDLTRYLHDLKIKGIKVLYTGYNWNFLIDGYPQAYVSEPKIDFVKSVRKIKDINEIGAYVIDVMRKYICRQSLGICKHRLLRVDDNSLFDDGIRGESYLFIIPEGTGLKPYNITGGMRHSDMDLPATDNRRLTEPDANQAFYMLYECGKPAVQPSATIQEGKIVGGSAAVPHSWPWIISINRVRSIYSNLMQKEIYTYNYWKCGGTIVALDWVITAAHCFAKGNDKIYTTEYKVVAGIHNQDNLDELEGNVLEIQRIVYHPYYENKKNKFDVALIQTQKVFVFQRDISPACLPNPDVIPMEGKVCVLAGWGYTSSKGDTDRNILQQAVQYIENPRKCQSVYRSIEYNPNVNICSKKSSTESSNMQCRGDSGGPLVCLENTKWVLYGVANWGPRVCEKRGYGGYLLVPSVMEWICCYITSKITPCLNTKCNLVLT